MRRSANPVLAMGSFRFFFATYAIWHLSKRNGVPSWMLCFMYAIGLVLNSSPSVNQMALLANSKDALLAIMFKTYKLAQYTLSRFFTTPFAWRTFGQKRVARLQEDSDIQCTEIR